MPVTAETVSIAAPPISAPDLILDLLATRETHTLPVATLRRAAAVFGISEHSVRVSLVRLVRRKKITSTGRGVYSLKSSGNSLFREVESWLDKENRAVPWNGGWIGVFDAAVPRSHRSAWRRHERALDLRGFRTFEEGLRLRPDNLAGGVATLRREIVDIGLAPSALVFAVHGLSEAAEADARRLWDVAEMHRAYRELLSRLDRSTARLGDMPVEQAAAEVLILGRTVIRHIVRDPLLPDTMLASGERTELIAQMRRYYVRGIKIWREVLG